MPTLQYRRLREDMIEVYKIINGIYDHKVVTGFFELSDVEQTKGHNKKLRKLPYILDYKSRNLRLIFNLKT